MTPESPAGSLTWVGHASSVIEIGGYRVLTDPLLRRRVAHLRRRVEPVGPDVTADVDLVLISHAHMDHLHVPSLRLVAPDVPVVAPRGTGRLLRRAGRRHVVEVAAGDRLDLGDARIEVTPAMHKVGRGPHTRLAADPIGFVVEIAGHRTYFAGDTDLFDEMADLGDIDLALLPIWGWGRTIGVGHLDPERAVEAAALIRPGLIVPVHWGTFSPENLRRRSPGWLWTPGDEYAEAVARRAPDLESVVLRPGASLELRHPSEPPADR